ncbi:MAG: hypothetical protein DRI74_02105 [Bacteroidetes bacterium]|nr:MAG: hypothetical protein DRI74_02105 [Bacteroidota bacterium]
MKYFIRTFLLLLYITISTFVVAQQETLGQKTKGQGTTVNSDGEASDENLNQNDSLLNIGNLKNVKTYSFYPKYIGRQQKETIDTILFNVEFYSPVKQAQIFSQDLGIIGSASTPLIIEFNPKTSFDIGIHAYDLYIRDLSEVELIETTTPFTQLSYTMGPEKENVLRIQHAQSFKDKQIKAGIDFKLFNTIGSYTRQKTDVKNFNANIAYRTKDKRYSVEGVYFHNKLILQENGGIVYDSLYEDNLETNRQIISVNLAGAENFIKYSGIGVQQDFYISKAEPDFSAIPDTNTLNLAGYSVQHYKKPYFDPITPLGRLSHTFLYSKEIYQYTDSDGTSAFYNSVPNFPEETSSIFDSIGHSVIENTISYSNSAYKDNLEDPKFLTYSFGLGFNAHRYLQYSKSISSNFTFTEINPQARLQLFLTKQFEILATGLYSYRSDNTSAYKINGDLSLKIKKNTFNIAILSSSTQAKLMYEHFLSDYFQWDNNLKNEKVQEISFQFIRKETTINVKTGLLHDYLYLDRAISPQQYSAALSYFNISLNQEIRVGNFGIDLNLIYQEVSDKNIIRLPKIYSNTKLFYTNTLFKGAMDIQLGINIRYFSSYYANTYMPALRSFYIQDEKEFGNYPYFDVFLNAKIKRARLFIKYEQLNASFMSQNYFISPHYANADAAIKFGVIWQLFN